MTGLTCNLRTALDETNFYTLARLIKDALRFIDTHGYLLKLDAQIDDLATRLEECPDPEGRAHLSKSLTSYQLAKRTATDKIQEEIENAV